MNKRNIKKRIFQDSVVEIEPQDSPVSKRKRQSKKKFNNDSDDSFQYVDVRKTKADKKLEKKAEKLSKKNAPQEEESPEPDEKRRQGNREEVRLIPQVNTEYVVRFLEPKKPKVEKERKIFNPEDYFQHCQLKAQYEERLNDLQKQYGQLVPRHPQPKSIVTNWEHLLKHIQQVGKERMQQRQHNYRLAKKIARYAQMSYNKIETVQEQKNKDEEKKLKRVANAVWKTVQKDYWRNVSRVHKFLENQQRKKDEKEVQSRRLQQLVQKQLQVSNKISQMMEGIEEVQLHDLKVSNDALPPIIINVSTNPYNYLSLQEDKTIRQPLLIKHPLRQYQLLGMHWIYTLHNRKMNGILADQMGLGKTIQTISFLAHLALSKGIWGPHLVIVPTSIIINWEIEFKRWCPAFKIMTYFGTPKERKLKRKGWSKLNSFHVCITSYKIVVTDHAVFKRKKWYYMVLDEAQHIKNYKSQRWQTLLNFNARYRLLLTGTPLQNDISQLWSLLHFLRPSLFSSFQDFNQWFNIPFQQALEKNFPVSQEILRKLHTVLRPFFLRRLKKDVEKQLPQKTQKVVPCPLSRRQKYLYDEFISHESRKNPQVMGMMNILMQLKKVCNHPDLFLPRVEETPFMLPILRILIPSHLIMNLDRIPGIYIQLQSALSFQQLAQDVIQQFENVKCTKYSFDYYVQRYRIRLHFLKMNYLRSNRNQFSINQCFDNNLLKLVTMPASSSLMPIQTIEARMRQFEPLFENFLFCVPKVAASTPLLIPTKFSHKLHQQQKLTQSYESTLKDLLYPFHRVQSCLQMNFPEKNILLYDSGKLVKLVGLLKNIKQRSEKVLIFTQMTKMIDIFEKIMNMHKFNYVRLDGSTKTEVRQQLVERFNNDPRVLCFISSTRSGGIGLNLTGASNVIFYDTDWNPAMDKQAQDRCHRIGQTRNVTIYRLISEHTIQQNILLKSIQKRKLDELVTEDGMFNTQYFQKVNIRDMLQGVIAQGDELEGDLAAVQDNEDREMLHQAELEGRQNVNEFVRDEVIDVAMLPNLFSRGLQILKNIGMQQVQESQSEQSQNEKQESQHEQEHKPPANQEIFTNFEDEQQEPNSLKVSDFQRISGMITYQKHYNYIKRNFYENQENKVTEEEHEE